MTMTMQDVCSHPPMLVGEGHRFFAGHVIYCRGCEREWPSRPPFVQELMKLALGAAVVFAVMFVLFAVTAFDYYVL